MTGESVEVCGNAQPEMEIISPNLTRLDSYTLMRVDDKAVFCDENKSETTDFFGKIIFDELRYDSKWLVCSKPRNLQQIFEIQKTNASAVLFLSSVTYSSFRIAAFNNSNITIPIYFINPSAYENIEKLFDFNDNRSSEVDLVFSNFDQSILHPGMIAILAMAMICIVFGGLWSGSIHRQLFLMAELKTLKKSGCILVLRPHKHSSTPSQPPSESSSKSQKHSRSFSEQKPSQEFTKPSTSSSRLHSELKSLKLQFPSERMQSTSVSQKTTPSSLKSVTDHSTAKKVSLNSSAIFNFQTAKKVLPAKPESYHKESLTLSLSSNTIEMPSQPFTWCTLMWFVIPVIVILLLLYFLFAFFVWVIIIMFTIASAFAMYFCLAFLMDKFSKCGKCGLSFYPIVKFIEKRTKKDYSLFNCFLEYKHIALFVFCAACSVTNTIMRKHPYIFIFHNIISMFFCIFNIRQWITLLLSSLLIYDIFMVFISPFLTKGCSIMVEVATGGACSASKDKWGIPNLSFEELPILFRFPRFDPSYKCYNLTMERYPSSMLGLADVIVPGFLVGFNYAFDLGWNDPYSLYFVTSVIGYFFGMITTFAVLISTHAPQPALVYLVPFILIPTHILALVRKQWKFMWKGQYPITDDATLINYAVTKLRSRSSSPSTSRKISKEKSIVKKPKERSSSNKESKSHQSSNKLILR